MEEFTTSATIPVRRILIEINERTNAALTHREEQEHVNISTLFNRAMQVYNRLMIAQENGERIIVGDLELRIT